MYDHVLSIARLIELPGFLKWLCPSKPYPVLQQGGKGGGGGGVTYRSLPIRTSQHLMYSKWDEIREAIAMGSTSRPSPQRPCRCRLTLSTAYFSRDVKRT